MKKEQIKKVEERIALTGRVSLVGEEIKKVEIEESKNIRYVYNPNPFLVRINQFNIALRPGELVDLVQITKRPEEVYSSAEIRRAVNIGLLFGFSTLDELEGKKLKKPSTKTPIDEYKEKVGIVITQEGTPVPIENIRGESENVFAKEFEKVEAEEERAIAEVETRRRKKSRT